MSKRKDIFLRFPGGRNKVLTLSYDDGVEQDIRMVELLRSAGIKCTFNISAGCFFPEDKSHPEGKIHRRMTATQCLNTYTDDVCEVAIHGYNHTMLPNMDSATACCEIIDDRRELEALFGRQIHGMAYPYGLTNDTIVDILRLCGVYYSRTIVSTEKFTIPATADEWLRLPATCHHVNPRLMELCDQFLAPGNPRPPKMFYLWGHTYEFDEKNNWHVIEEFVEKMKGHDDIWYATNMEVYQAWKDFRNLEISADGSRIYNPNLRDVWFEDFGKNLYKIAPGESIVI